MNKKEFILKISFETINGKDIVQGDEDIVNGIKELIEEDCGDTAKIIVEPFGKDKQMAVLEKALELACETIKNMTSPFYIAGCLPLSEIKDVNYFKQQSQRELNK